MYHIHDSELPLEKWLVAGEFRLRVENGYQRQHNRDHDRRRAKNHEDTPW